jgi:hypothetical protein
MNWVIIGLVLVAAVLLFFYYSPSIFKTTILATAAGPFKLSEESTVTTAKQAESYYAGADGAFQGFVYLNALNKTGSYAPCGTNPNQPSCENGKFAPCACDASTGDCNTCSHAGYSSVLNIAGVVGIEVLLAPDASRQGKAMTQLVVKTEGPAVTTGASGPAITASSQVYMETFRLPELTIQQWTMITVSREGRRFDIYYNDRLVLSQKTMYMPVKEYTKTNLKGVTSGAKSLGGELCLVTLYAYRVNSLAVAGQYKSLSDTRGTPLVKTGQSQDALGLVPSHSASVFDTLTTNLPSVRLCPEGGCFGGGPTIRPASPLYDAVTPYG